MVFNNPVSYKYRNFKLITTIKNTQQKIIRRTVRIKNSKRLTNKNENSLKRIKNITLSLEYMTYFYILYHCLSLFLGF